MRNALLAAFAAVLMAPSIATAEDQFAVASSISGDQPQIATTLVATSETAEVGGNFVFEGQVTSPGVGIALPITVSVDSAGATEDFMMASSEGLRLEELFRIDLAEAPANLSLPVTTTAYSASPQDGRTPVTVFVTEDPAPAVVVALAIAVSYVAICGTIAVYDMIKQCAAIDVSLKWNECNVSCRPQ